MINIAIDGPAGAGKSSVAKAVAKKLGFIYVDTGALYRAVGVNALKNSIKTDDKEAVTAMLPSTKVELKYVDGVQRVILNDEDVSEAIRMPEASMAASNVSAIPEVRAFLLDLQHDMAEKNNVIMDGRDIGTVIIPDADLKVFMTASAECRAMRRFKELTERGQSVKYEDVLAEMNQRDGQDSSRAIAPTKAADDAIYFDNSELDFEQTVDAIIKMEEERAGGNI